MKLRKPVEYCDANHESITLKLDDLTGKDVIACMREAEALRGRPVGIRLADIDYLRVVAAKAARVPVDLLDLLDARDFDDLVDEVRDFFMGTP